jgi:ABC-type multidrug transport system fused ATPase/permease subunit
MQRQINYLALAASILTFVLIAISMVVPWWQFKMGDPAIAEMALSPVTYNLAIFGTILTMPLIYALTLGSMLTLTAGGIIMLIYAFLPTKSYSKQLLGFGYKKPLYAVILFSIALLGVYFSAGYLGGMNVPINGSGTASLPEAIGDVGVGVTVKVFSSLNWPFYIAIIVAVLCIAARIYHRKIIMSTPPVPAPTNQTVKLPVPGLD